MENIYHLLTDSLSPDSNLRIKAELNLKEAEKLPEYPIWLANILVSDQGEMGTRQSAGIQLKTWVNTYWSSGANKEVNLEPSQEVKQQVKQLIIQGLSSTDSKIRTTSAFVVARVAHYDWPEQWPDFLEGIVGFLTSGSTEVVVGSLQVLTEFSSNDLTEQRITAVVPVVFPQLFNVLSNPQIYSPQTRANAITVFGNMMEVLHIVKESDPNLESELVLPLCSDWIQSFLQILSGNPTNANELVLMLPVFKCLGSLIPKFPNLIKSQILQIIQLSIQLLNKSQKVYTEEYIYSDSCELPNIDSDPSVAELSEIPKLESMLYTLFDILISVVYKKGENGQSILTGNGEVLDGLVWALIPYLQISKEQSDIWAEDPNKFVADEDDQTFNYSVRVAAQDVFMALENKFAIKTVEALSKSVPSYVQLADQAKQGGNPDWWTILEACLVSIGLFSQKLTETFKQNNGQGLPLDISSLFESIVLPLMAVHDAPYAQGRAFIFTSQFASILPSDLCNKCISETLQAAKNSQSTTVRISCLKSLHNFSRFLDNELVAPYQKDILESTFHLVEFNKSDVLILILEIWLSVIQINSKVTGDFEEMMTPKVMEIWVQFSTDPIISALVFDIIEELAKIEAIYSNLVVRVLPGLKQVMGTQVEDPVVIASAIDVLTSVVRGGPSPLPAGMVNEILPTLVNYFGSDDHSILQNIQDCLKNLIYKDPHQFAQWSNASGQNGFEVVLNFIFSVLQPGRSESEALFAGDVIVIMMIQAGDAMTNYIPSILNSVVNRLQSANTETFCQSLLMVICHVLRFQMHDGLNFLAGMDIEGVNGLELVLRSWLEHHDSFSGYYAIKLSAYVLSKLFLLNDTRLKNITVQGDLINPNPNRILTRSQTRAAGKQYTQIPAMTKILSLLIDDLNNNTLDNQQQNEFGSEKDFEDEWEDVEDEEGMFLSDMLDYGLGDFDENDLLDDELFKSDELYNLNMNDYLKEFFQSGIKQNLADFHQFAQGLNGGQQEFLQSL